MAKKVRRSSGKSLFSPATLLVAIVFGALFGLSAPGFDQWYLSWVGLVPLLLLTVSSDGIKEAFLRGLAFGAAYNLVYLNWYLHLDPLSWLGYNQAESMALAAAAWIIVALQQALITGLIAAVIRMLPLTGGFLPRKVDDERWCLPSALVLPLFWVIVQNKLGNAHDFLGVPWTMIEYSQYKQLPIIQISSWIGGIGLGAIIVLFNVTVASLIASVSQRLSFRSLALANAQAAFNQTLTVALCIVLMVAWGFSRLGSPQYATETLSVLQGNINIEMEKSRRTYTLSELFEHYGLLLAKAPPGLCIWTESAVPAYLKDEKELTADLKQAALSGKHDMIVGSIDRDFDGRAYNAAFGIDAGGHLCEAVYHKRYLVPFGEYMPGFVHYLPQWVQRLTSTPAGVGFHSGNKPVILNLSGHEIAPLICFETLSPELVVESVRAGGTLLVNLSDLAWFHKSMVGDQMVAFSTFRAVETARYFVFAANTGPSAIIDEHGRMIRRTQSGKTTVLTGKVHFNAERTAFTQWFN